MDRIPHTFLTHTSDILADQHTGYSWSRIAKYFLSKSIDHNVDIPYSSTTFPIELANKRTGFLKNLEAFPPEDQYEIILELCNDPFFSENSEAQKLRGLLVKRYNRLEKDSNTELDDALVEDTKNWLSAFPKAERPYNSAIEKYKLSIYQRNLLDDLRLSLELLLKEIFKNEKSLENQINIVGAFYKDSGTSVELRGMLNKLLDYYSKYHNANVKHNDNVNPDEIEFIIELTSTFMKHLIKLQPAN